MAFPGEQEDLNREKTAVGVACFAGTIRQILARFKNSTNHFRLTWRYQSRQSEGTIKKENAMLWTIAVILLILWALGLVSSYTVGGFIHILLVIALVVVAFGFLQGRRV